MREEQPYTYIPHNASFLLRLKTGSKRAHPIVYYFLLSFMTVSHTGSAILKKEAFPRFWGQRFPNQSIMLCVLMIDSCIRDTISSARQQAWKGVNQLSTVAIWRTARLWLEFSITASTIHHVIQERMKGSPLTPPFFKKAHRNVPSSFLSPNPQPQY